jgi:hypothetical protein
VAQGFLQERQRVRRSTGRRKDAMIQALGQKVAKLSTGTPCGRWQGKGVRQGRRGSGLAYGKEEDAGCKEYIITERKSVSNHKYIYPY